ncbi:MAG: AAA family ATPase [Actinomycetota bacterium]|nr:AAA family ATPase [Actinomycetota bacterium]
MNTFPTLVTPLVGRDTELRVLQTVVTRVLEKQVQVVALSGQAGVGKSRLAQECLAAARGRGFLQLQGFGGALQRDLAYAPLVEALRPLVVRHAGPGRPALVEGLPDLGRLFGDLSLPPGPELGDPGLERTRLFESVCRLLERASARQPLALLLDDVHWADRGSLALLHYLVRGLVTCPLLVLLTYREDQADPALRDLLAGLRRAGSCTELRLAGLSDQAVGMLAQNLLDREAPAGFLDVLTARSGGVPLFVDALVGSFVDSGALYRNDGRWVLAPQHPEVVPAVVSVLLQSQVEGLPHDAREVLDLLAVCGAQADHALLERLLPDDRVLRGLADLRTAGLVVEEVTNGQIRYRATHALLCEVAYDLLPLVVRRRRHAAIARAVEEYAPAQCGMLAQHVRRAGDEIDPGHALGLLLGAADQALARKAGDEALADVRAALGLAEAADRPDVLPGLLDRLAEAYELAGHQDEAVSAWSAAAAQHPKGIGRAERLRRAAVLELDAGRCEESRHYLSEAAAELADVEPVPAHLSLALTRLQMTFRTGSSADVGATVAELERLEDMTGLPRARIAVLSGRCHLALAAGRYVESRTHLSALLALVAELGDDALGERARRPGFVVELNWGDLNAAHSIAEEALRLAWRTGVPSLETRPQAGLGVVAFYAGEWEEALQRCCEVVDLAQRVGLPRGTAMAMGVRGLVLLRRGRLDDASACAMEARKALGPHSLADRHVLGPIEVVEASVALARDDAGTAAAMAAEALRRFTTLPVSTLMVLAEAQVAGGDPQAASATAQTLSAMGPGAPYPGALAAWVQGRLDQDETLLRRAADDLAALGFVYEAAVAQLDLAELAPTQADGLGECLQVLERLGAQPQVDRARRLLRRLGQRPPAPPRQRRAGSLSPREEQVARLVAAGLSNPEIAQRLYLSPRTVTTHLQNMYGRLELRSRAALTRYVLEELPPDTWAGRQNT